MRTRKRAAAVALSETAAVASTQTVDAASLRTATVGDTVGGYRLVRMLGEGRRSCTYLGRTDAVADEPPRTAAVKVYRAATDTLSIDTELRALGRIDHPHVTGLVDVTRTATGQPAAILELAGVPLGRLVTERTTLSAGEAVTILAPLGEAVDALHACGVAHGRIRLGSVLFRSTGAPVLAGFGGATLFAPGESAAALGARDEVRLDRQALQRLAISVLERVPGAETLLEQLADPPWCDGDCDNFGRVLAERLFEFAEPQAVALDGRSTSAMAAVRQISAAQAAVTAAERADSVAGRTAATARADPTGGRAAAPARADPAERRGAATAGADPAARRGAAATRSDPASASAGATPQASKRARGYERGNHRMVVSTAVSRALAPLRHVRPRVLLVGAGVAACVVAGLLLVPTDSASTDSSPTNSSPTNSSPTNSGQTNSDVSNPGSAHGAVGGSTDAQSVASAPPASSSAKTPPVSPSAKTSSPSATATPNPSPTASPSAIVGDDPVAAIRVLLETRLGCLRDLSVLCLDSVAAPGSTALESDTAVVRAVQGGGEQAADSEFAAGEPVLVQRLGDSALVSLGNPAEAGTSKPASALLMKGEAGWRIRDYLDE